MDQPQTPEQQRADDCMREVLAVFEKWGCEPVIEVHFSSHQGQKFELKANTIVKKEGQA